MVSGASTSGRVLNEIVLAHELTHALEDQRLGLDQERLASNDDRALAYLSLVEGSATDVMYDYGAALLQRRGAAWAACSARPSRAPAGCRRS